MVKTMKIEILKDSVKSIMGENKPPFECELDNEWAFSVKPSSNHIHISRFGYSFACVTDSEVVAVENKPVLLDKFVKRLMAYNGGNNNVKISSLRPKESQIH